MAVVLHGRRPAGHRRLREGHHHRHPHRRPEGHHAAQGVRLTSIAAALPSLATTIPSPTVGAFHLGPLVVRAYALCILLGITLAVWLTGRRLADRGHPATASLDIAAYAVPFGIIGGRLWHLITNPQPYFGAGGHPLDALKIWHGGLGIWGAVALGAVGAWIGCRKAGVPFRAYGDSVVPGIALAHAIGRVGNWFNNELYGRPTTEPWGLTIHQWDESQGRAVVDAAGKPVVLGTYQPTFLYELVFLVVLALVLLRIDKVRDLAPGQLMALYFAGYPLGRVVVELMRTDEANHILGLRVNVWTSIVVFVIGVVIFVANGRAARRDPVPEAAEESASEPAQARPDHDVR